MSKRRGRSTGSVLPHKKGKWRGAYRATLDGKRLRGSKVCPTKSEAEAWLRNQLDAPTGSGTLGEWLDRWEAIQRAETEPGTHERDFEVVALHVRPQVGAVKFAGLTANRINGWLAALKATGRTDATRQRAWVTLRKILRAPDTFPRGNLDRVKAPTHRYKEAKFLSPDEYDGVCRAADAVARRPYLGAMVRVWVECCCRPREAVALRWEDYADGVVKVRQALCPRTRKPKALKTERSARDVPLTDETRELLERWRAAGPGTGPMFPNRAGGYWNYRSYTVFVWGPVAKAAGVVGYTPYCLRHTGPTLLLARGGSIIAVARRMGHTTATLVLKTYGHALADDQNKLTSLFGTMKPKA